MLMNKAKNPLKCFEFIEMLNASFCGFLQNCFYFIMKEKELAKLSLSLPDCRQNHGYESCWMRPVVDGAAAGGGPGWSIPDSVSAK